MKPVKNEIHHKIAVLLLRRVKNKVAKEDRERVWDHVYVRNPVPDFKEHLRKKLFEELTE